MVSILILPILVVAVLIGLLLLTSDPEAGSSRDRTIRNRQDPQVGNR